MGQKVHPYSFRIGSLRTWHSRWFAGSKKDYKEFLHEDLRIRKFLRDQTRSAGVARIDIQRAAGEVTVVIYTSKPGILIGHSGGNIEKLRDTLKRKFSRNFDVKVSEIRKPDIEPVLVADSIARQVEKRISYRRAAKAAMKRAMEQGAKGIKIVVGGRLNGADIARTETYKEGNIPLHTIRADVDYATEGARTKFGMVGIKVWIYRGMVFGSKVMEEPEVLSPGKELRGGSIVFGK